MRVDETVLKRSVGRTVVCVAKGRIVDVSLRNSVGTQSRYLITIDHILIVGICSWQVLSSWDSHRISISIWHVMSPHKKRGLGSLRLVPTSGGDTFASFYIHGNLASFQR